MPFIGMSGAALQEDPEDLLRCTICTQPDARRQPAIQNLALCESCAVQLARANNIALSELN